MPDPATWLFDEFGLKLPQHHYEVLQSEAPRIMVCDVRGTGKTTLLVAAALWYAYCHPGSTVLYHGIYKSIRWFFTLACTMLTYGRTLRASSVKTRANFSYIVLPNDSIIRCVGLNDALSFFKSDLLLVDEADYLPPETVFSMLLGARRAIAASTPNPHTPHSLYKNWCLKRGHGWHLPYYPYLACMAHNEQTPCACLLVQA